MVTKMIYLADGVRMKVIQSVLKEELANSLAMQKSYQRELAKLPKGALVKKNIKGHAVLLPGLSRQGEGSV